MILSLPFHIYMTTDMSHLKVILCYLKLFGVYCDYTYCYVTEHAINYSIDISECFLYKSKIKNGNFCAFARTASTFTRLPRLSFVCNCGKNPRKISYAEIHND
jgi:hypothetical protein